MYKYLIVVLFFSLTANAQKIYKTPSGAKYHLGSCRMVNNVSEELSFEKAAELGLTPCKICKPQHYNTLGFKASTNRAQGQSQTVQCKGITKKGTRCKHMTSIANGYCFQHNPAN
ncbi:DUF5763 domain-containing protein [Flavobacterium sp. N1994]|uniref:DUF5763 domain-containing protein n=1 Tax=Flavobacterium sp. N1994 TaxID=2986827 RepID=UPI0022216519|nr:DUF5763 domain-containing protein [Flavobacterium sp. N1994]